MKDDTLKTLAQFLLFVIIMLCVGSFLANLFYNPNESSVSIYTDKATGCQYLVLTDNHLTPRLDVTGRPLCGKAGV